MLCSDVKHLTDRFLMIQNIVKKTHVLELIWIPEFSTLWMDLNIFYYAHNSKKILLRLDCNCWEQKFCSTYTGFSRTQRALDDDTENAHSSINRSSHSNFPVAQFQNISSCWPMNFLWIFLMRIVEFCYEFIAALTLILTFWRSANLLNVPLASKVMNWKTERHKHRHTERNTKGRNTKGIWMWFHWTLLCSDLNASSFSML